MLGTMIDQPLLTASIDASSGPEIRADRALVPWWSFTKTALAAAALKLVARGYCRLDQRLGSHPYTLRQLLQHRAGVPDYGALASYHEAVRRGEKPWAIDELLDRVAVDRLDFPPGQGWRYSNVGYLFVRQFIENAVGRDIGGALRSLVFDALGLVSVRMAMSARDLADTAWGNRVGYDPGWVYHGLLLGTPADAVRFLHSLMTGDVLPPDLLTEMTTSHAISEPLPGRPWATTGYGLGLMIGRLASAGIAMGHSGAGPGSVSAVYHFRDRPGARTVAAFATGDDEGTAENEVVHHAQSR
jgi:CubicO group peptidase (beta-lactamase class C family)